MEDPNTREMKHRDRQSISLLGLSIGKQRTKCTAKDRGLGNQHKGIREEGTTERETHTYRVIHTDTDRDRERK